MKDSKVDITELKRSLQRKAIQLRDSLATVVCENNGESTTPVFELDAIANAVAHLGFGGGTIYMKILDGRLDICCTNPRHGTMVNDFISHSTDKKATAFMLKAFELLEIAQVTLEAEIETPEAQNKLVEYLKRLVT